MKRLLGKNIFFIFWIIASLEIIGIIFQIPVVHFILKPLLMPVLMAAVLLLSNNSPGRQKITGALLFAFLGDLFLLFEYKSPLFFMLGLFFFLVTHVFYIFWFYQIGKAGNSIIKRHPYFTILIVLYATTLLYFLMPGLGDMKIPVIIYAVIISVMLNFSLRLPFRISKTTRQLLLTGAFCFVISDSLLAVDKFYKPIPFASGFIMITYCMAQYFIVKGFIRYRN